MQDKYEELWNELKRQREIFLKMEDNADGVKQDLLLRNIDKSTAVLIALNVREQNFNKQVANYNKQVELAMKAVDKFGEEAGRKLLTAASEHHQLLLTR